MDTTPQKSYETIDEASALLSINDGETKIEEKPLTIKMRITNWWTETRPKLSKLQTWVLFLYLVGLTVFSALNFVFIVQMSQALPNYSYFCSEMPIIAYLIVFYPIVWYKQLFTKDIPAEVQTIKGKRYILAMAFFDQCADILMVYGAANTKGPLVPIFTQSVVPLTMVASIIVFKRRYWITHYVGALVVIGGVISSALTQPDSGVNTVLGNILLIGAGIPASIAAVIKEMSFKRQSMDLYYLNAWESLFQFMFSLALTPLMAVLPPYIPLNQIPANMWYGMRCVAGYDSLPGDTCLGAWKPVFFFVLFDIIFNIFLLLVVKYGSAALMFACNTISLPVGDLMFTMPFIVGAAANPLNKFDLIGLAVIIVGLIIYRVRDEDASGGNVVVMGGVTAALPIAVVKVEELVLPRTREQVRGNYFARLGVGAPMSPAVPSSVGYQVSDSISGSMRSQSSSPRVYGGVS